MSTGRLAALQTVVVAMLLAMAAGAMLIVNPASAELEPQCTITGTAGNDVLEGTPGDDVICGGGGNDIIKGLRGNDILRGEAGGGDRSSVVRATTS